MCLLTEAIRVEKKKLCNLEYHQARFDKTRKNLFGLNSVIDLSEAITVPKNISDSTYKCRIVYSTQIMLVEFTPYEKRLPKSIQLVFDNNIDYSFKYEQRDKLKTLVDNSDSEEILIVKNGLITDTSRSNVVLCRGNSFVTPSTFLLDGTMRRNMLDKNIVREEEITVEALFLFEKLFLINAMLDLENQPGFPVREIKR